MGSNPRKLGAIPGYPLSNNDELTMPSPVYSEKQNLLGKLVRPNKIAATMYETRAAFENGEIGIIIRAEWEEEERILYIEVLVGEKTILLREYKSVSSFWLFWKDLTPKVNFQ